MSKKHWYDKEAETDAAESTPPDKPPKPGVDDTTPPEPQQPPETPEDVARRATPNPWVSQ